MKVNTNMVTRQALEEKITVLVWGGNGIVTRLENGLEKPKWEQNEKLERYIRLYKKNFGETDFVQKVYEALQKTWSWDNWAYNLAQYLTVI